MSFYRLIKFKVTTKRHCPLIQADMLRSRIRAQVSALNNCEEEIKRHLFNEDFVLANGSKFTVNMCLLVFDVALPFRAVHGANVYPSGIEFSFPSRSSTCAKLPAG